MKSSAMIQWNHNKQFNFRKKVLWNVSGIFNEEQKPTLMLPTMNDRTECVHFQKPFSQMFNEWKGMEIEMCTFSKTALKYLMTNQLCGQTLIMNENWEKRYILWQVCKHTLAKSFVDQRFGQIYFKMTSFSQFPMVQNCLMHKRLIAIVKLIKQ